MKLSAIAQLRSFALLGPGFTGGPFVLVSALRAVERDPTVVFVPYESDARDAMRFAGEVSLLTALDFDLAPVPLHPDLDDGGFHEAVATIRASIAAGDVYQVNHTLRARLPSAPGAALLAKLCEKDIPRFAAWVRLPDGPEFVSASPELFFLVDGDRVRAEPMKGTAPRGAEAKLASAKEHAELAMITDLLRNDLTRVCVPRSVRVTNARRFVELPYAVQAVSDVEGLLAPGVTLADVLGALHPGGSITGAPKEAAREIISMLEPTPRGAYCGALGFVDGRRATFSLLIRTATRTDDGWTYGVGGGITWGSDADAELAEVRVKLGALA